MRQKPHALARYVYGVILASGVANAAVQLLNIAQAAYPDLSSSCIAVLNQEVACDATLSVVGAGERTTGIHRVLTEEDLESLCTDRCAVGLDTWVRRVSGACADARVPAGGESVSPNVWAHKYLEAFDSVCLVDQSGSFCNPIIGSAFGIDPVNQQATADTDPSAGCNTCFLSLIQTQLAMPLAYTDLLEEVFTSLTSTCSETDFTVPTRATTDWIVTTTTSTDGTPEPTPTCDGTTYEITEGETCEAVSTAAGISTLRLLLVNNLGAYCSNFPTSGSLCIPDDQICTPYTIQEGDTCASIAKVQEKTYTQIVSWNPELGRDCQRIKRHTGLAICVSSPGGEWVNPRPTAGLTTTLSTKTWNTDGMTPVDQVPLATRIPGENFTVIDWAPDTRQDCRVYHAGGVPTSDTNTTSAACADVAASYLITLDELLFWNPSLTEGAECALRDDAQYCVGMVEVVDDGMTEACVGIAAATVEDDCRTFRIRYGLSEQEFTAWNPVVGEECSDFTPGMTYCVAAEHFRAVGIVSSCNKFVTPEETRWMMNPCKIMEDEYGLSHARFVAWNPDVGDACTAVFPGYEYCVSIPNYRPTFSASATATDASATAAEEPQITSAD